jgi:hypothetical protein
MNSEEYLQEAIQSIVDKAEQYARMEEQIRILKFVRSLHEQKRISDDVAHTFFLEFTMDM